MTEFGGRVERMYQGNDGKIRVVIPVEGDINAFNQLGDYFRDRTKLRINVKKWREKRSLDANAYCWVLMTKIAEEFGSSKDEIYEEMLQKYGVLDKDDDGVIAITVASRVDMSKIDGHWRFYSTNGSFSAYLKIKGTSEYDSKEMAYFLDMVVQEAKDIGIQTETPDEIAKMKALWGVDNG